MNGRNIEHEPGTIFANATKAKILPGFRTEGLHFFVFSFFVFQTKSFYSPM